MKTKYLIFDLDDTLVYEIDYLKSAYYEIAIKLDQENVDLLFQKMWAFYINKENVFDELIRIYPSISKEELLGIYRNHYPSVSLIDGGKEILEYAKNKGYNIGLITDGRSITQRNKLRALGIEDYFDKIIISEEFGSTKPNEKNFRCFMENEFSTYIYVADNPKKDFITPNRLNWISVCLINKGWNIHPQIFDTNKKYLPKVKIRELIELKKLI